MRNLPHKRGQDVLGGTTTKVKSLSTSGNSHHLYRSQGLRTNLDSSGVLGEIIDKTLKLEEKALTFEKLKYSMKQKEIVLLINYDKSNIMNIIFQLNNMIQFSLIK